MEYTCKECNKKFTLETYLRRHLINIHKISQTPLSYDENVAIYKCLICHISYKINTDLISHLRTVHGAFFKTEELRFKKGVGFNKWKRTVERKDCCKYILFPKKSKISSIYGCNKTGNVPKDPTNRKYEQTSTDNWACISYIRTQVLQNGDLHVARVKTHYGHEENKLGRKPKASSSSSKDQTQGTSDSKNEIEVSSSDSEDERPIRIDYTQFSSSEPESMDEDDIEHQNVVDDAQENLKNNIKSNLNVILLNLDQMDYQNLVKLGCCLDGLCHELDLSTKKNKNGQIIISSNSNFDHNYL